jgi:hypothetical protein
VLAFTSVYFSESRHINGLRPIQIRKTAAHPAPDKKGSKSHLTSDLSCLRPTIQRGIPLG